MWGEDEVWVTRRGEIVGKASEAVFLFIHSSNHSFNRSFNKGLLSAQGVGPSPMPCGHSKAKIFSSPLERSSQSTRTRTSSHHCCRGRKSECLAGALQRRPQGR